VGLRKGERVIGVAVLPGEGAYLVAGTRAAGSSVPASRTSH